jgi:predicted AAA+ superfamily ATPase
VKTDVDKLLARLDQLLPAPPAPNDWNASIAFRWRKGGPRAQGWLQAVRHVHRMRLSDLQGIDAQIGKVEQNTKQFLTGRPANNVLLTGARGTGKSSIVKGLLNKYQKQGLRPAGSGKKRSRRPAADHDLVSGRKERFIVFCDDLTFHGAEEGYIALKVALDGSISTTSENMLIYATSNPPPPDARVHAGEPGDEIRRRRDPSRRDRRGEDLAFRALRAVGVVLPVRPGRVPEIVAHWLKTFGCTQKDADAAREEALQWSLQRGSRSGRVAYQFARDWAGRKKK